MAMPVAQPYDIASGRGVLLLFIISFLFFGIRLFSMQQKLPYHPDEFQFVGYSEALPYLLRGDFRSPYWGNGWLLDQPKLASYFWGMSLGASGVRDIPAYLERAGFGGFQVWWNAAAMSEKANSQPASGPSIHLAEPVAMARRGAYAVTLFFLAVVAMASVAAGGYLTGIVALWIVAGNPLISSSSLRAMADGLLLLFTILTFWISLMLLKDTADGRHWRAGLWCILGGIIGALAVSTKLNGILSLAYFFPVAGYGAVRFFRRGRMWPVMAVFLSLALSAGTFLLLAPFLWPSFPQSLASMIHSRMRTIAWQQGYWPESALVSPAERLAAVWQRALSPSAAYGSLGVLGTLAWIAGLVALGLNLKLGAGLRRDHAAAFLLWAVMVGGVTAFLLPLDWDRYYLPIVMVSLLIQAYGISVCLEALRRFIAGKGRWFHGYRSVRIRRV